MGVDTRPGNGVGQHGLAAARGPVEEDAPRRRDAQVGVDLGVGEGVLYELPHVLQRRLDAAKVGVPDRGAGRDLGRGAGAVAASLLVQLLLRGQALQGALCGPNGEGGNRRRGEALGRPSEGSNWDSS